VVPDYRNEKVEKMNNHALKPALRFVIAAAALTLCAMARGETVEELRIDVPVYRVIKTHVHRPKGLKPGERLPALLIIGHNRCKLATNLSTAQRIVCVHFSPTENIPAEFRAWEDAFGHAGQDAIALLLKHLLALPEVNKENTGIATMSFGVVGATGALARHPDLHVKFLIDWEGPSGPQNLRWIPSDHRVVRNHPVTDEQFWKERTASEFVKRIQCRYLRIQAETDHVQTLGSNQHAIEMLNNATKGMCPWTRCNNNPPNTLYNEGQPEDEKGKWLPGRSPPIEVEKLICEYGKEMIRMPPLAAKGNRQ
jgi:hypothetical protein